MNWIDYIILICIGFSSIVSLFRGFIKELCSWISWLSAIFITRSFYSNVASLLTFIENLVFRELTAGIGLFLGTILLGNLSNEVLLFSANKIGLRGTNHALGALLGLLRGVLIVGAILILLELFTDAPMSLEWQQSLLAPYISRLMHGLSSLFSFDISGWKSSFPHQHTTHNNN